MEQQSRHTPASVEVRGWRDGELASREVCESEQEARALAENWAEQGMTRVDIDDLTVHHSGESILGADSGIDPVLEDDQPG